MINSGGTLYAIRAEGTSLVKIGYTRGSVEQRIKAMQTGQPFPLRVIATHSIEADVRQKEAWLHAFLKQERRRGEWFEMALETDAFAELIARAIQFGAEQEAQLQAEKARRQHAHGVTALGLRVRHERERQGFSREELTQRMPEDMRMHTNTLWSIEVGRTKNPRMDQLQALALALGVSVPYLMGETDAPTPGRASRRRPPSPNGHED